MDLKNDIIQGLKKRNIHPTKQAAAAIREMILRSRREYLGDSDTLLMGLLYSGSYTVDILEAAGVKPQVLRELALRSSEGEPFQHDPSENEDPFDVLFNASSVGAEMLERIKSQGGILETSHILTSAISPRAEKTVSRDYFPLHLRRDKRPESALLQELELRLCELLTFVIGFLYERDSDTNVDLSRTHATTDQENSLLVQQLKDDFTDLLPDEIDFIISALNKWFVYRQILTDPADLCLRSINNCSELLIAPKMFIECGGNIKSVDFGLQMASKYSPERDLPNMALFLRDDHIHVGEYTYRNTFIVNDEYAMDSPLQRVQVQALRPVPIVAPNALNAFSNFLSRENLREAEIQHFLTQFPEILATLGYVSARPHICLRTDKNEKLIPDFMLELPGLLGFDILDLKLPTARLTASNPYLRMSSELMKAVAQLRKYAQFFDSYENRIKFERRYGFAPFKPELIIVMGRSSEFKIKEHRVEIEQLLDKIRLVTYDDLLAYGKSRSIYLSSDNIC